MANYGEPIFPNSGTASETKGSGRLLNKWQWIESVCIDCGATFTKRSTARRTQRCEACTIKLRQYRREGHKISAEYTRKWRDEGRRCEQCGLTGSVTHHRVRLADGGAYDESNLEFLCGVCHDLKHWSHARTENVHAMLNEIIIP